jgi:argininosuccinate lyase
MNRQTAIWLELLTNNLERKTVRDRHTKGKNMSDKLWAGRFTQPTDAFVEEFTASINFDQRLYRYDILGSVTHARMLARQEIISDGEAETIIAGLNDILLEIEAGSFIFSVAREDIHMNIEARLIEKIGSVGGKLHTARSRNDQVALDVRLYLRDEVDAISVALKKLQAALLDQAEANLDVIMPGYTHLQTAQPVLFAHHMLAYVEMLARDTGRLHDLRSRLNLMPLGAGALAGTTFPIDREYHDDAPLEALRGTDPLVERRFCLYRSLRWLLHRQLDHAAEEKPRCPRTGAR